MKPIKRAIIILDQNSSDMQFDGDTPIGFDLRDNTKIACDDCLTRGVDIMYALPEQAGMEEFVDAEITLGGEPIHILQNLQYLNHADLTQDLAVDFGEKPTALITADRRLRGDADAIGMVALPDPVFLELAAEGVTPNLMRIVGAHDELLAFAKKQGMIPIHFQPVEKGGDWALIAWGRPTVMAAIGKQPFTAQTFATARLTDDFFWARAKADDDEMRELAAQNKILFAQGDQVLIALRPDQSVTDFHIHGEHGHNEFLAPDINMFKRMPFTRIGKIHPILDPDILDIVRKTKINKKRLSILRYARPNCADVTAEYASDIDRYTGITDLDTAGPIMSRHISHLDNKRVESQLIRDLNAMGYCAYRHNFVHAGQTHSNIIADLPGAGYYTLLQPVLNRYQKIFSPRIPFGGLDDQEDDMHHRQIPDRILKQKFERFLKLEPWYPWWQNKCPRPGIGAGLIVVGAHLDSTANFSGGYNASTDAAPGRDDNASGLASVLSMARYFARHKGALRHTIRFCFFNAEEAGLVGSKAYAAKLKALNTPIRGVFCTDMMGYNSDGIRSFEVHAGYTDPSVRDASVPLAARVANAAASYGLLEPAQVYKGTSSSSGSPDRDLYDGAINRSDHAAFHQQGYGAILTSEDFFANLATESAPDPNPNYHKQTDQFVDIAYARDITCAVTKAVLNYAA